jgi:flagellar hook assembly protein FlgD
MSVSAINPTALSSLYGASSTTTGASSATTGASSTTSSIANGLTESDFLNLLVKQLQNQDPLNPTSDTDFASQLEGYSSLQQMTTVNTNISSLLQQQNVSNATAMLGKQVTTSDGNSGIVSKMSLDSSGNPSIYVGTSTNPYSLSDITNVSNAAS